MNIFCYVYDEKERKLGEKKINRNVHEENGYKLKYLKRKMFYT